MAKQQSFSDKVKKKDRDIKRMAQIVVAEKKTNGHYRFRSKMIDAATVKDELAAARK